MSARLWFMIGPPRPMTDAEHADAWARYRAQGIAGVDGAEWYDAARDYGLTPSAALDGVRRRWGKDDETR